MLGVVGAHIGELDQVLRRALHVGPRVDEDGPAVPGGHHGGQGRPADALDALDKQGGRPQQGAGGPGGHEGVTLPVFQQVQTHGEGGVLLLPEGGGRVVADLHHLGGVGDLHPRGQVLDAVVFEHLQDVLPTAHQGDVHPVRLVGLDGPHDRGLGRVVAAHGVHDDLHVKFLLSSVVSKSWARRSNLGGSPLRRCNEYISKPSFQTKSSDGHFQYH